MVGALAFYPFFVQVMKIIMTLTVEEAGRVHYVKRPGALLEAGCVIARLELDDPTKVKPVSPRGVRDACWGTELRSSPGLGCGWGCALVPAQGGTARPCYVLSRLCWGWHGAG